MVNSLTTLRVCVCERFKKRLVESFGAECRDEDAYVNTQTCQ